MGKWLCERLKPANCLKRWIEKIKDSKEASKQRTFDFLWGKLEIAIKESRHEANAKSVTAALTIGPKVKVPFPPAAKAGGAVGLDNTPAAAAKALKKANKAAAKAEATLAGAAAQPKKPKSKPKQPKPKKEAADPGTPVLAEVIPQLRTCPLPRSCSILACSKSRALATKE
jgi:hypothetical protein